MQFRTNTSPFVTADEHVSSVMLQVIYALIPGTLLLSYFYGWGILINILLAIGFALGLEALALKLRKRPVILFLGDYSAVVTAWLLALSLPPLIPWWLILIGIFFAIIIAKHLFGGLGYNPFNPAMVGFAVLIISFPFEMSQWLAAGSFLSQPYDLPESLKIVFSPHAVPEWDAVTMATPLDEVKTGLRAGTPYDSIINQSPYLQSALGNSWLWVSLGYLAGGLWLLYRRVIHWQIPFTLLATVAVISGVLYLAAPDRFGSPMLHLFGGGTILGAFFIATDPVSASTTPAGKIIYAAGIGFFIYIIRIWGNYPDAVAFSVLIMNMAVPMIDYYTQPRVLGHRSWLEKVTSLGRSNDKNGTNR